MAYAFSVRVGEGCEGGLRTGAVRCVVSKSCESGVCVGIVWCRGKAFGGRRFGVPLVWRLRRLSCYVRLAREAAVEWKRLQVARMCGARWGLVVPYLVRSARVGLSLVPVGECERSCFVCAWCPQRGLGLPCLA